MSYYVILIKPMDNKRELLLFLFNFIMYKLRTTSEWESEHFFERMWLNMDLKIIVLY
jgi:hypothetical protein